MSRNLSTALLKWYDTHQRTLPWRVPSTAIKRGVQPDVYRVWLAEVMLQQTTVATVKPYYEKFLKRWPTVEKLARAKADDVLAAWAGLGYYSRARNLHACAKMVVKAGGFPTTAADLKALPGVGEYIAAAVAAIAYGESVPVVDGNIVRVMARLHAVATPLPAARKKIDMLAAQHTPAKRNGDYIQALMDLGATICTPRAPRCPECPLRSSCAAYEKGRQESFPVKSKTKTVPHKQAVAYVITSKDGYVLLRRRPPSGLLGGMVEVPTGEWLVDGNDTKRPALPRVARWRDMGAIEHIFSHFRLRVAVRLGQIGHRAASTPPYFWVKLSTIKRQALPTVMVKILQRAETWP
jgi:A/G-specific adenine glycosylase